MGELTVYGGSDDLLELRGDIRAEAYPPNKYKLLLSDGTLLKLSLSYGWTIEVLDLAEGTSYELYSDGSEKAESIIGREGSDVLKLFNENGFDKAFVIDNVEEVITDEN